tara:strand:- start:276 stop:545 length:270 start_codon:yes stop_codon:yes gene_type:complete
MSSMLTVTLLGATSTVAITLVVISVLAWRRNKSQGMLFVACAFSLIALRVLLLFFASWSQSLQATLLDWRLALLELIALMLLAATLARR